MEGERDADRGSEGAPASTERRYDALLDAELAKLDERPAPPAPSTPEGWLSAYLRSYGRSVLPFALALGGLRALEGGSLARVLGAILGGALLAGFLSFVLWSVRRGARAGASAGADVLAPVEAVSPTSRDEAHADARLDEELRKLDERP
jgi:hypothetical protein